MEWTFVRSNYGRQDLILTAIPENCTFIQLVDGDYKQFNYTTSHTNVTVSTSLLCLPQIEYDKAGEIIKKDELPVYLIVYESPAYYTQTFFIYVKNGEVVVEHKDEWSFGFTIDLTTPLNGFMGDSRVTTAHLTPPNF